MPRRRDQARSAMRSYKKQAAEKSGMHHVRAWWNRLPGPVRRFGPAILVLRNNEAPALFKLRPFH